MKKLGIVAAMVSVGVVAGCGRGSSSKPHVDYIAQWTTNVMHETHADAGKYRPLAKSLCHQIKAGDVTRSDLAAMPQQPPDGFNGPQMLAFEYAAIKQYCPAQTGKLPVSKSTGAASQN